MKQRRETDPKLNVSMGASLLLIGEMSESTHTESDISAVRK